MATDSVTGHEQWTEEQAWAWANELGIDLWYQCSFGNGVRFYGDVANPGPGASKPTNP